jgi:RHS repeat-associated protein
MTQRSTFRLGAARFVASGLALCAALAHAQSPANPYSYTRTSSFTYNPTTGLLVTETVEPTNPQSCVVTTHGYDVYGNKATAQTANCAGATGRAPFPSRAASSTFAAVASQSIVVSGSAVSVAIPAGQFPDTSTNALKQSEHSTYDPRFGTALSVTGPNSLTTRWSYDDFGRKTKELRADGTYSVTSYCYLAASGLDTSSNSSTCASLTIDSREAPPDAASFVDMQPFNSANAPNGPFSRVYLDRANRKLRMVTQAFDAPTQVGGASRLIVQDIDYNQYGVQTVSTQPYFLDSKSSTSSGSNDYGMSLTVYDRLGRPTTNYVTDNAGSQASVAFGSRGSRKASITRISYVALKTTTTNDHNQSKVDEKNVNGEIVRTTDALGAQLARQFDAFGNLVATRDALQNSLTLAYDIRGRKTSLHDPDTGVWNYDYDALGELVWQQSPKELVAGATTATTMVYDAVGRMTQRVDPGDYTSTWNYDTYAGGVTCPMGVGKLCQTTTTNGLTRRYTYDGLGRSKDVRTDVASGPSFATTMLYDNVNGRVSGRIYPTGLQVNYNYTGRGFLLNVQSATSLVVAPLPKTPGGAIRSAGTTLTSPVLWAALSANAWGALESQRNNLQSDGVTAFNTTASFDPATGRVVTEQAGLGSATNAMNLAYVWDSLNHVTQRTDNNGAAWVDNAGYSQTGAVGDSLVYDAVGRLQTDTVAAPAIPGLSRTVDFEYNALGMLLYKSDVGVYAYPAAGAAVSQPHAVQSVAGAYAASYTYDANGNAKTASAGGWRSVSYNSFNLPDAQTGLQGPTAGPQYTWLYDENHARFKEVRKNAAGTRTTWMLHPDNSGGLGFEREEQTAGNSNRHYISAGATTIGVIVTTGSLPTLGTATSPSALSSVNVVKVEFWHVDRQGSLMATTDHAGAITQIYAYDSFGKRRNRDGRYDASGVLVFDWTTNTDSGTDRGYTGHEHLDDVELIHMNGRLYDPVINRFMQGDPFIGDPGNLADYDRFAYCMNNPVTCTDPSGYLHIFGHNILPGVFHNQIIMTCVAIVAAYFTAGASEAFLAFDTAADATTAAIGGAAVGGFTAGAITTGTLKGAVQGAVTSVAFFGAGSAVENLSGAEKVVSSVALHAVVGCASNAMGGGKCGPGALSAAFSDAVTLTPAMEQINARAANGDGLAILEGTTIASISGGTASVLGKGKFSNGAETGAFGYLFNQLGSGHIKTFAQVIKDSVAQVFGWQDPITGIETPPVTLQVGMSGQAGAWMGGVYGETGVAITVPFDNVCLYANVAYIGGPQIGAAAGPVVTFASGSAQPSDWVEYRGATYFGGEGLGGNLTITKSVEDDYGISRANTSGKLLFGEIAGAGYINGTQKNFYCILPAPPPKEGHK